MSGETLPVCAGRRRVSHFEWPRRGRPAGLRLTDRAAGRTLLRRRRDHTFVECDTLTPVRPPCGRRRFLPCIATAAPKRYSRVCCGRSVSVVMARWDLQAEVPGRQSVPGCRPPVFVYTEVA